MVNVVSNMASNSALRVSNIVLAEEELSVQVRNFNVIIISNSHLSFSRATNTHKSECLDILTSESASTDHESIDFGQFFLDLTSVNKDLVVVSAVHWCAISWATREGLKNVVVQPLLQRRIFSSILDYFLGNDTTEESSHGRDARGRVS